MHIISFNPGIIDTDMQNEIRSSKDSDFPDVAKFIEYKSSGELRSAETVAEVLIDVIYQKKFDENGCISIHDIL